MLNVLGGNFANARGVGAADDGLASSCDGIVWPFWRGLLRKV